MKKYTLTENYNNNAAGTTVYKAVYYDYGLANDDTRTTGVEHISVTLKEDGGYPFFTIPAYILEGVGQ